MERFILPHRPEGRLKKSLAGCRGHPVEGADQSAAGSRPGVGRGKEARVARVPTVAWLSVLVGSVLASAEALAAPPDTAEAKATSEAGQDRPSRTQVALSTGIDSYRR